MKRLLILLSMLFCIATAFTQNITKAEYFFDTDPGFGNGTSVPGFSPADVVNFTTNIPTNTLAPGFHVLLMRVRNSDGVWSLTEPRYFYISSNTTTNTANITAAEYFIDTDPGPGNGISASVGITGSVVNFTAMIQADLSPGFHRVAIRTKDANGKWGLSDTRTFYVYSPAGTNMPIITGVEYFFDHDPGVGSGTPLSFVTPGDEISQPFMIPVPAGMSAGDHFLTIRAKDQAGNWGLFEKDTLTIGAASNSVSCPANVTIDAAGQCSAVVNNIDPVITPAGSPYIYTLSGATAGSGTGTASGKTFNAGVTTVTYALFNSPSINCSFTVTVNSGITPTININASGTEICPGQQVAFTTIPFNGGATPSYQWKLNGTNIPGETNAIYQSTSLTDGDLVSVSMTSSLACANPQTVESYTILINVSSSVVPWVGLGTSATTICTGTPVNFIAVSTNGGISPTYQWKLNGNIIPGVTGSTYQSSTLANGDRVSVIMTSSLACANPQTATYTGSAMTVTPTLPPSVYLESSYTTICAGTTATFYANPTNGGTNPSYQWKVNGNNVGSNSDTYSSSSLQNGDTVTVAMTSSLGCASPQAALSSPTTMTVLPSSPASVNITASSTTICSGTSITFNVTPVTAGASYQWQLNGNNIAGGTNTTYQSASLQNGDKVKVIMTQSSPCFPSSSVTSNEITISVNAAVAPSVTIGASATTICPGQLVTFTATPINGGNNPNYQWKVNGNNAGTNSYAFSSSSLHNGDIVTVTMTSSLGCASPQSVTSAPMVMTILASTPPSVNINASAASICPGQQVAFTATPVNGGATPSYQWKLNGNNVGSNYPTYQNSTLQDGDSVRVVMTSSISCAVPQTVTSAPVIMTLHEILTPAVSAVASATTICSGQLVTFTATPTNGGSQPIYQWVKNGVYVDLGITYQTSSLANSDSVYVILYNTTDCIIDDNITSNVIHITMSQMATPSVTISAPATTICPGQLVTFTATPTNGGNNPNYGWTLNGNPVGSNSNTYQSSTLHNGDVIKVAMGSSLSCASPGAVNSNTIAMTVGSGVTPSVSITASAIDICAGQQVTFTATPTNGGNNPIYQWKLNGNNVGSNSPTYQTTSLANADTVRVVMTSSLSCAIFPIATSNYISMDVSTSVLPSVSITADLTYICQGELVKFTATPTNGGNPTYQWKVNGNNVGTNSNIYQSTGFANNDSIEVVMTSSLGCAVPRSVTSNNVFMTVTTAVTPQVSIESSSSYVCAGTLVTFTATPVNGGTPSYQWKLNGNNVGTDYYKYESSGLSAGDIISVSMTTTLYCVTTSTAPSNSITMEASSSSITYYRDLDGDGYGNSSSGTIQACGTTAGYASNNSDCNDNNAAVNPEAAEICGNGIDDDCNGQTDENCTEDLPVLIVKTYPAKEGDVGYTTVDIEVRLDRPAISAVRLNYATSNDDAIAGSDYVAANGVLIIPVGSSSATIQVKVIGDLLKESNERFWLNFTNPVNVVLPGDPRCRIMIIDNDKGKVTTTAVNNEQVPIKEEIFKIPTVTRRNQVWAIPQIGNYENEVLIVNVQGQVVSRFVNYHNHTALGNVSAGLYFYRIRIMESPVQYKYYSGRLLITE